MSNPNATRKSFFAIAAATVAALALAGASADAAGPTGANGESYEWSAELIAFDSASRTAVVKARVESYAEIDGLHEFSDGDRLILTWTGMNWAAGIRGLEEDPELTPRTLSLPVEFVSADEEGRYISFRIPVPDGAIDAIADMEAGTRITGTTPRMATDWMEAVSSLRHYNDVD